MDDLKGRREQRLERIYQHLLSGHTHANTMRRFGLESSTFYEALSRLKVLHPDFDPPPAGNGQQSVTSDASRLARARLGQMLWSLRDNGGQLKDRQEVAELTGIPARKQLRAESKPYDHDWSFSQIERLAEATGQTFSDIMRKLAA